MSSIYSHATYDEDTDSFVFDSKYNFSKFEKKLIAHFKDGGSSSLRVLAGVMHVSAATVRYWLQEKSEHYKPELKALVEDLKELAVAETDKWHRESASGRRKDANSATLNRRAEHFLGMAAKTETVNKVHTVYQEIENLSEEEVKERLKALEDKG